MKVSQDFVLQEFVPKDVYNSFGDSSIMFLDQRIITITQAIRDISGKPIIINNWHKGGSYQESGYRKPDTKTGAKYSQHKFGRAGDLKVSGMSPKEVVDLIVKNQHYLMGLGLTTIESVEHTPTWVHIDCRWTGLNKIKFVNP